MFSDIETQQSDIFQPYKRFQAAIRSPTDPGLIRGTLSLLCECSFLLTNEATAKRIEGFQMVGKLLTECTQLDYGLSSFNCSHWVKS